MYALCVPVVGYICGKPYILSGLPLRIKISVSGLHTMRHFRVGVGGSNYASVHQGIHTSIGTPRARAPGEHSLVPRPRGLGTRLGGAARVRVQVDCGWGWY